MRRYRQNVLRHAIGGREYNWCTEDFDAPDLVEAKALMHELA